jgi:hypothetical protein
MDIQINHAELPCGEWLDCAGFTATEAGDKSMMRLLDGDGEFVATVTRAVLGRDLQAMLRYGKEQRELGEKLGRAQLQSQFRALLATDPT